MVRNYLAVAWRNLLKHRSFSLINILGLAIGIAAFWLILHYVFFERSYESFNPDADNIYRVQLDVYRNSELVYQSSENYPGVGKALKDEFPEVIEYGRLYNMGSKNNVVISRYDLEGEPIQLKQTKFLYADETVLTLLGRPMISGDSETALSDPFTMVISQTMARNYFGGEDPIGKTLRLEDDDFNDELCKITGVFEDPPPNSHLKFHVLISMPTIYGRDNGQGWATVRYKTGWVRKDFYTYVKLQEGTDPEELEKKFPDIVKKYKPDLEEEGGKDVLQLQALSDIHLYSRLTDEAEVNGNGQAVVFLMIIAGFILVIAWINYINLSTSKAMDRAKEVGIRKVMGSYRRQLILQFIFESLTINGIAIVLASLLVLIFTPYFNQIGGTPSSFLIWIQPWFWISILVLFLFGGVLAGIYPAFVLSSYRPITVLRGKLRTSTDGINLRRVLVTLQFVASVSLIIGTSIVYEQMSFMQNRDLGYSPEQIIVTQRPAIADTSRQVNVNNYMSFKTGLESQSTILGVTNSMALPGKKLRFKTGLRHPSQSQSEGVSFAVNLMDYNFMDMMGMELVAGRNFSKAFQNDPDTAIILNETGIRALGFASAEEAIGKNVVFDQWRWRPVIVGVLKDYHQESLQEEIVPIATGVRETGLEYMMVKVNTNDIQNSLQLIEDQWNKSFRGNPFDYFFLDEYFNSYYEAERQFKGLFSIFTILAIVVGCLGLFGLTLFSTRQRSKEIGIRKVLGANVANIVILLVKDVLILILIANLIAWPVTYYFMNDWLNSYPYAMELSPLFFIGSTLIIVFIAFLTVSTQTIKSAQANPVDALKYE